MEALGFLAGLLVIGLSIYFLYLAFRVEISDFLKKKFPDFQLDTTVKNIGKSISDLTKQKKRKENTKKRTGDYFHDNLKKEQESYNYINQEYSDKSRRLTPLTNREKKYVYDSIINRQRVSCFNCMTSDMVNTNQNKDGYNIWVCSSCRQILGLLIRGSDIDSIEMFNYGMRQ